MSWEFTDYAKAARMAPIEKAMRGGALELCTSKGTVLARIGLHDCSTHGATLVCSAPDPAYALGKGRATQARIVDSKGKPVVEGLTVGKHGADVNIPFPDLVKGNSVSAEEVSFTHA